MAESQHEQAKDILMKAFAEPVEEPQGEDPKPTEELEEAASTSETLETQEETPPPVEEQEDISTLNNLAETLDISIEDMYALSLKMPEGIDPTDLGTLKNFYLENKDLDQARQEIENERSKLQTEKDKIKDVPPVSQEHIEALAQVRMIEGEWQQLEASGLKQSDAGQYSARAIELQNKYSQATGVLNNIQQIIESKRAEKHGEHQRELHKLVPELKEESTRQVAVQRVTKMLDHYGLSPEVLGVIEDHHAMHMILEMSKLFEQKGNYKSKRVDTAPKVLKPQAVRNSEAGKSASLKRLTEKARQSGERKDQVNAVSALLNRG